MNTCIYCGATLPPGARFCGICGRHQESQTASQEPTVLANLEELNKAPQAGGTPAAAAEYPLTPVSGPYSAGGPASLTPPPAGEYYGGTGWQRTTEGAADPSHPSTSYGPPAWRQAPTQGRGPTLPGAPTFGPSLWPGQAQAQAQGTLSQGPPRRSWLATAGGRVVLSLLIVALLIAGGLGAYALYLLTRPQPVISLSSPYHVGTLPAGAQGTTLHVIGAQFAASSSVRFLLDSHPLAGITTQSDSQGKIASDLPITAAWNLGRHTISAVDAANDMSRNAQPVIIVQPGEAGTPGPNGAPPDSASFHILATLQGKYLASGQSFTQQVTLVVSGHPDPAGGSVCGANDSGRPRTLSGTTFDTNTRYRETQTITCQGSYRTGKLDYTRIAQQDQIVFLSTGPATTCKAPGPYTLLHLTGSFTSGTLISGRFSSPRVSFTCDQAGAYFYVSDSQGTWSGYLAP